MEIYVAVGIWADEAEVVWVGTNREKAFGLKCEDFSLCDSLFIETWMDGKKIDEINAKHTKEQGE